jgi:hypothetical protein
LLSFGSPWFVSRSYFWLILLVSYVASVVSDPQECVSADVAFLHGALILFLGPGADLLALAAEGRFLRQVFFPSLVLVSPLLPGWRILPLGGLFR